MHFQERRNFDNLQIQTLSPLLQVFPLPKGAYSLRFPFPPSRLAILIRHRLELFALSHLNGGLNSLVNSYTAEFMAILGNPARFACRSFLSRVRTRSLARHPAAGTKVPATPSL